MSKKKENTKTNKKKINIKKFVCILLPCLIAIVLLILSFTIKNNNERAGEKVVTINEMVGKTVNGKVVKVQDINGDIFYLPKGFKISEKETEQIVKNGLVIIDDTGDKETNGSEFVWIPVENSQKVFNAEKQKYRTLYYDMLQENNSTEEYLDIQESIVNYGGFYISRYEAGISEKLEKKLLKKNLLDNDGNVFEDTTQEFANGKYKPISKTNSNVWTHIKWGGTFKEKASDDLSGNDKENGAVKVARSMYKNSKTTVKSNLCYGFQWDAIMNFIDSNYYTNTCDKNSVIEDSSSYGNYNSQLNKTASNIGYTQKNIYDLAGNVWEWTMEGYSGLYRVTRGGSYCMRGDYYLISSEKEFYPSDYYKELGFRVALWID